MHGPADLPDAAAAECVRLEPALKWYAIRVRSNFERVSAHALSGRGHEAFLPVYVKRQSPVEIPLFRGYIFGRFDVARRCSVLTAPGVVHIVSFGRIPAEVHEAEIAALKVAVNSGLPLEPCDFVNIGQRVIIEAGPLRGVEGIVIGARNSCRLLLSVTILQRSVSVEIDRSLAAPIGPASISELRPGIPPALARTLT